MAGLIEWETVEGWLSDKIAQVNYAFDNAVQTLTVSPFDSSITVIDTAMKAVEGTALVLVSMFFAIQLCSDAMMLKIQSYEQVFKLFFKFILANLAEELEEEISEKEKRNFFKRILKRRSGV